MITSAADVEDVEAAVVAFGLGDLVSAPEAVAQAWSNAVYRIDTTQGSFAVKLFNPSMPQAQQRRLHRGMALERHVLDTGLLPVPQPVPQHDGWIVTLPHIDGTRHARCHEWVPGVPAHSPLPPVLIEQAGTYLARLHSLRQISGDTSQIQALDLDRWTRAARSAIQLNLPFAVQLTDLTPLVQSLAADLDELRRQRRPMRLSHNDYDPKNAIISDAGPLVITDWDYAGPVLADVELIVAATSFAETDDNVRRFVRAYRAAGGDAVHADELAMTVELADSTGSSATSRPSPSQPHLTQSLTAIPSAHSSAICPLKFKIFAPGPSDSATRSKRTSTHDTLDVPNDRLRNHRTDSRRRRRIPDDSRFRPHRSQRRPRETD